MKRQRDRPAQPGEPHDELFWGLGSEVCSFGVAVWGVGSVGTSTSTRRGYALPQVVLLQEQRERWIRPGAYAGAL